MGDNKRGGKNSSPGDQSISLFRDIIKIKPYPAQNGHRAVFKRSAEYIKAFFQALNISCTGKLTFRCNICGNNNRVDFICLGREAQTCRFCGSIPRWRAIVHLLSMSIFGRSMPLPDFPLRKDIAGIGMSDCDNYARPLSEKFSYQNTFYDKEPKLDISNVDTALYGKFDFIISSDVFEHVLPPVSVAFENVRRLLKPGGVFIFTAPYMKTGATTEHFPGLNKYEIIRDAEGCYLKNIAADGAEQIYRNLVFHGGDGATLEMRLFSEASLIDEFAKAGFEDLMIGNHTYLKYGIYWPEDWALPMVAK
jgi:SAM-dependent methyltransferase